MMSIRALRQIVVLAGMLVPLPLLGQQQGVEQWADEIAAFEQADRDAARGPGGVVFVGSSSIRFWDSLAEDFPTLDPINRGFGGSRLSDVRHYLDQLVMKHRPRLVVLYAGENDINADVAPEQVFADYRAIADRIRSELPETRLVWISIKPSPLRWADADAMRRANALVMEHAARDPQIEYVDVFMPMLNEKGEPRGELFVEDRLHLNDEGYRVWKAEVDPYVRGFGRAR